MWINGHEEKRCTAIAVNPYRDYPRDFVGGAYAPTTDKGKAQFEFTLMVNLERGEKYPLPMDRISVVLTEHDEEIDRYEKIGFHGVVERADVIDPCAEVPWYYVRIVADGKASYEMGGGFAPVNVFPDIDSELRFHISANGSTRAVGAGGVPKHYPCRSVLAESEWPSRYLGEFVMGIAWDDFDEDVEDWLNFDLELGEEGADVEWEEAMEWDDFEFKFPAHGTSALFKNFTHELQIQFPSKVKPGDMLMINGRALPVEEIRSGFKNLCIRDQDGNPFDDVEWSARVENHKGHCRLVMENKATGETYVI
jgi:hypothetical protein